MNTAKIAAVAARLFAWAQRRAGEKSTYVGLAAVAAALGKSVLADHLTNLGNVIPMVLGAGGVGLVVATTTSRSSAAQTLPDESATTTS